MTKFDLHRRYTREEIAQRYGYDEIGGIWGTGVVPQDDEILLFVTLDKRQLDADYQYDDGFESLRRFRWQTQNRARQDNAWGRRHLDADTEGTRHHLFVREDPDADFLYLGRPQLIEHEGNEPITIWWELEEPLPEPYHSVFNISPTDPADVGQTPATEERLVDRDISLDADLESLDGETLSTYRKEQGELRRALFGSQDEALCGVCGRSYPVDLLVAAHLKPRKECSGEERRDIPAIGMPMCLLGCDALYEQGYISIKDGIVVGAPDIDATSVQNPVDLVAGREAPSWTKEREPYVRWHRKHIYRGSN